MTPVTSYNKDKTLNNSGDNASLRPPCRCALPMRMFWHLIGVVADIGPKRSVHSERAAPVPMSTFRRFAHAGCHLIKETSR